MNTRCTARARGVWRRRHAQRTSEVSRSWTWTSNLSDPSMLHELPWNTSGALMMFYNVEQRCVSFIFFYLLLLQSREWLRQSVVSSDLMFTLTPTQADTTQKTLGDTARLSFTLTTLWQTLRAHAPVHLNRLNCSDFDLWRPWHDTHSQTQDVVWVISADPVSLTHLRKLISTAWIVSLIYMSVKQSGLDSITKCEGN